MNTGVLAQVDGKLLPIPINLDTINRLYGLDLTSEQLEAFFAERRESGVTRFAPPKTWW